VRNAPDVLVIGGGIIGCAVARALAGSGRSVLLVDRGALGGEASSAAAGLLGAGSSADEGERLERRRRSLAAFPALVGALRDETGLDVELRRSGVLQLAFDDADVAAARERLAARRGQGFSVEWLEGPAVRDAEPAVSPAAQGALLFPDDALVDPTRLTTALAASARARGAELLTGTAVLGAERRGDRIAAVDVAGVRVTPATVVLAVGAWAGRVPGVAPGLSVVPVRGQMLALRPARPLAGPVLVARDGYLLPARNGDVLVGATFEDAGYERAVTPAGVTALLAHVDAIAPGLRSAPIVRLWSGLRPCGPGGEPIVGRAADTTNLIVACGHHRSGILLAPWTADAVAVLV
jgi:glycine oxidase